MTTAWVRAVSAASAGTSAGLVRNLAYGDRRQEQPVTAGAGGRPTCYNSANIGPMTPQGVQGPMTPRGVQGPTTPRGVQELHDSTWESHAAYSLDAAVCCVSAKEPHSLDSRVRHDCGEDAFFIARTRSNFATALGIADGVGQWSAYGVDPAAFSWELMNNCQAVAENGESEPQHILACGFDQLAAERQVQCGSSTACVASLDHRSGKLDVANLGDSGALLVGRTRGCVLETTPQQHGFNLPYQFMVAPEGFGDEATDADKYCLMAQDGDILILATDGLFDNMWPGEILCVANSLHDQEPGTIAEALVSTAHKRSHGSQASPFSYACTQNWLHHEGGKPDDITVVVSRIKRSPTSSLPFSTHNEE